MGGREFLNEIDITRWCLFISDDLLIEANKINYIKDRIDKVIPNPIKIYRMNSSREATKKLALKPHKFGELRYKNTKSMIIPATTSERRKYIPIGFYEIKKNIVISNSAQAIYNAEYWIFGVIHSYIHNVWVKSVGGYLGTSIRYSTILCYNTFPFPKITQTQKNKIEELVHIILDERDKNYTKTMAELYDPKKMPEGLKTAHHNLDLYIESCYRDKPFENDEERLEYLFKLYEKMVKEEK